MYVPISNGIGIHVRQLHTPKYPFKSNNFWNNILCNKRRCLQGIETPGSPVYLVSDFYCRFYKGSNRSHHKIFHVVCENMFRNENCFLAEYKTVVPVLYMYVICNFVIFHLYSKACEIEYKVKKVSSWQSLLNFEI